MKKIILILISSLLPMAANAYDAYINGIYYNFKGSEAEVTCLDPEGNANSYSGAVDMLFGGSQKSAYLCNAFLPRRILRAFILPSRGQG